MPPAPTAPPRTIPRPAAEHGLLMVNTGDGKGKSTAAMGQALRAAGHGLRVCIIQFIKGLDTTGEALALGRAFPDQIEFHVTGTGFSWQRPREELAAAAAAGWRLAGEKIRSNAFDLVILDEFTYLLNGGLLGEEEALALFAARPARLHLLITGRQASPALLAAADLVTEMREVKHPYRQGGRARKGIEY
jgi:cob(I)alamin adenosyltransferase